MERGDKAARFIGDPEFMSFVSEVKANNQASLFATSPQEIKTRESIYYRNLALDDILHTLESYVEAAAAILGEDAQDTERD